MKFSLIKNDKSTFVDEIILAMIIVISMGIGITLIIVKPSIWIISSETMILLGALLSIFGFMFIPCLIYRLMDNDIENKGQK